MEARNLIVVSDLHLGHERASPQAFIGFLNWIEKLRKKPIKYEFSSNFSKEFAFPEKLILLGDILELYDPKEGNANNVAKDTVPILKYLSRLPCEKVYVTGNHDDSMGLLDKLEIEKSEIGAYARHYPPDPFSDSMRIGSTTYFFLHGHQYDKKIEQIGKWGTLGPYIIFELQEMSRRIFGLDGWGSVVLVGFLGLLRIICNGHPYLRTAILYTMLITAPFWSSKLIWRGIVPLVRKKAKPVELELKTLLEKRYYKPEKDMINCDFIVFGHTHYPGMCSESDVVGILKKKSLPKEWKRKGFVNTGGWFRELETAYNTFLYIDSDHIVLLRWDPQEERPMLVDEKSYIELNPKSG